MYARLLSFEAGYLSDDPDHKYRVSVNREAGTFRQHNASLLWNTTLKDVDLGLVT